MNKGWVPRDVMEAQKEVRKWQLIGWANLVLTVTAAIGIMVFAGVARQSDERVGTLGRDLRLADIQADGLRLELAAALDAAKRSDDALRERDGATGDLVQRIGRAEEALGICEDARREDADHLAVHHDDIAVLKEREGWLLRDVDAARCVADRCESEGRYGCDAAAVDFGGLRR